ncbi:MAG TPA: serine/threonine-protein kinase, partial [Candidatus Deferrimicrobium sp.]|nr:serine/threonine-protein kinase [Candidatus Deferrimicrobium sp.]
MLSAGSLFGHYRIESILGHGATGVVYKASEIATDRSVALKLLNEEFSKSPEFRKRLADEAAMAAQVNSPYVVKILEHSELHEQPFIAMECVSGPDIREAGAAMTFNQKCDLAGQIAAGIGAAHAQGLIHRDLKPENIRLAEDGLPRILDFGLGKMVDTDSVDESGNVEGTLHYLSPEQLSGEPLTAGSDVFSYGTILYELFTGRRPFEGEYAASIIYSILHEEPIPPSDVGEQLPVWCDSLILKLLAKKPPDRFQSVIAAAEFLKSCMDTGAGVEVEAHPRPRRTVTVIDLRNMSGDAGWDYFCEGFTDEVINELSR